MTFWKILAACALITIYSTTAHAARTCAEATSICISQGGNPSACGAAGQACRKTCKFHAPSGKSWKAKGDCTKPNK